jgi:hypothetical protein
MTATVSELRSTLRRILITPTADDLWQLQADLLALGQESTTKAREVAGRFYSCVRDMESKIASRSASRWAAVLQTAAVTSVGLQEMIAEREAPLKRIFASGVTAMLEVGAATKSVQAWEEEASLMYYDVAWYLYGELWDISLATRPELALRERQAFIDQLLQPIVDSDVTGTARAALLLRLFQVVLLARAWPLLTITGGDARDL